jgi:hypothetical protein
MRAPHQTAQCSANATPGSGAAAARRRRSSPAARAPTQPHSPLQVKTTLRLPADGSAALAAAQGHKLTKKEKIARKKAAKARAREGSDEEDAGAEGFAADLQVGEGRG